MRPRSALIVASLVGLLIALVWWTRAQSTGPTTAPARQFVPDADTPLPPPTTKSTTDPAEVFRRAFWRQPSSDDHILNAERRVDPDDASWQWFIQLHPSPQLLTVLHDPEHLGLLPLPADTSPRKWASSSQPSPTWFPSEDSLDSFEIRQSSASQLTILYRAADNTLFATDRGAGFAPSVRKIAD
ncbi:hypothetical protein ACWPKO_10110 [Coraliomargarita sp. W4R53]